jgi:hypothetical protein
MFLGLARIALLTGAALIVASLVLIHPPIYPGGIVEYPSQATAIAKRACHDFAPQYTPWRGWLSYSPLRRGYFWEAGWYTRDAHCMAQIEPRTGRIIELRMGVGD